MVSYLVVKKGLWLLKWILNMQANRI
jgi:hypothetical protein